MLYRELNTVGGYLSPACGGGKITSTQFFLIDKGILQWCAKGIVILRNIYSWLRHCKRLNFYQASDLGIEMNECRIYERDGLHHFMIKCFDRVNGRKVHMQTLHIILITDGYQSTGYL